MGSSKVLAFVAVLVVLVPSSAFGRIFDGLAPAPSFDVCDLKFCGKGTCQAEESAIFSYECECEAGWKRSPIEEVNDNLKFLPCVIPECYFPPALPPLAEKSLPALPPLPKKSLPALPPIPVKAVPLNLNNFDPCSFAKCGEGTCKNTSSYAFICECNPGSQNLFNISSFPCYNIESLGADCATLGLEVSNAKIDENSINHGTSFLPGKFHWMTIFVISVAMALWK